MADRLPESLTLRDAYKAAYYMVRQYVELERTPDEGLVLLQQYLDTDPARWEDWLGAVRRALNDGGAVDPERW